MGGCGVYHSLGDDPAKVKPGEEIEPPTVSAPLIAFDQGIVSELGQEPDIRGDLQGLGIVRTDGIRQFVQDLDSITRNWSTERIYTFCIWGPSRILNFERWELAGVLPGMRVPFDKVTGKRPIDAMIYELEGDDSTRHYLSRRRFWTRLIVWSKIMPPPDEDLELIGAKSRPQEVKSEKRRARPRKPLWFSVIPNCCTTM